MKYFFFENFPSAGLYIERRLAYSRSTATSSMIGYILGLGKFRIVLEGFRFWETTCYMYLVRSWD
jgi:hypothetical protein